MSEQKLSLSYAALAKLLVYTLLFTTGFTHLSGFWDGLPNPFSTSTSLGYWLRQHEVHRGGQPATFYLYLLVIYEWLVLALAALQIFRQWRQRQTTSGWLGFLYFWALGSLLCFSLAGERMPWLLLHPLLPMTLIAADVVPALCAKPLWRPVLVVAAMLSLFVSVRLNFLWSDNPREPLVYVQTSHDVKAALQRMADYKKAQPVVKPLRLVFDAELTWPFAWYLRKEDILRYVPNLGAYHVAEIDTADAALVHVLNPTDAAKTIGPLHLDSCYRLREWWEPKAYFAVPLSLRWKRAARWWFTHEQVSSGYGAMRFCLYVR